MLSDVHIWRVKKSAKQFFLLVQWLVAESLTNTHVMWYNEELDSEQFLFIFYFSFTKTVPFHVIYVMSTNVQRIGVGVSSRHMRQLYVQQHHILHR